jgi:hypothetical protein
MKKTNKETPDSWSEASVSAILDVKGGEQYLNKLPKKCGLFA